MKSKKLPPAAVLPGQLDIVSELEKLEKGKNMGQETWMDFNGEVDRSKRYDIELRHGQKFRNCAVVENFGELFFETDLGNYGFSTVSQYRESDNQDAN